MSFALSKKITVAGKVRLLLWKNFTLQKRHYYQTIFDVFVPVVFFIFYALLYKFSESHNGLIRSYNESYPNTQIDRLELWQNDYRSFISPSRIKEKRLVFSPNNTLFKHFTDQVSEKLGLTEDAVGAVDNEQLQNVMNERQAIAGIYFHHPQNTDTIPKNLAYSLRFPAELRSQRFSVGRHWDTTILYEIYTDTTRLLRSRGEHYHREGFLTIQNAIAKAFFNLIPKDSSSNIEMPQIRVQRFPSPAFDFDHAATSLRELTPIFLMLVLCFAFMNTVRLVTAEKEKQLKEAMKIMGLSSWTHYLGWFVRTALMLSITMTLITALLTLPCFGAASAIFTRTSFICMLIFFVGYSLSLITFSFMICTFFAQAKSAVTAAMAIWFITSMPYLISDEEFLSVGSRAFLCICPNTALGFGIQIINNWELMDEGLNWRTAFQQQNLLVQGDLCVAAIFGLFICYSILFFLITIYTENVFPGAYGVAKPWYFIFTKKFWQNFDKYQKFSEQSGNDQFELAHSNVDQSNHETEPVNQPIGIEIKNLTKKFLSDSSVVDNLSLNIYYNQITSLLGHNGAGKTTTVAILTGMTEPTSGTALINGFDIRRNMDSARSSMGFCPQHNILFDELTVREHILFYCCLKGLSNEAADKEAQKYTRLLELGEKENAMSSTLSGGMKRKLSVVIALCGHSKVVFLDEPTSGMDPGARRALWDILLAEKKDRAILLTTHFMDEADVLSDRIAILADGELKCTGSTFFLKKRFGTGYHLICAKGYNCSSGRITDLLQKYMPDIQVEYENDSELSYVLPETKNELFSTIFKNLENNENRLNISGFGVSLTTLEEVFMKLGKSENVDALKSANGVAINHNHSAEQDYASQNGDTQIILNENFTLLDGPALWKNQAIAMFKKRFLCWLRAWPSFLYYILFTIFMMSLIVVNFRQFFSNEPPGLPALELSPDLYKSSVIVLQDTNTSRIAKQYENTVNSLTKTKLRKIKGDMETALHEIAAESVTGYRFHHSAGASFMANNDAIAWHNHELLHAAPIALNLLHVSIIKTFASKEYSISITNEPLPIRSKEELYDQELLMRAELSFEFLFPFIVYMIMAILSAKYTSFYIEEKQCNAKFMQYVSGIRMPIFWGVSILWDMLTTTVIILIIIPMLLLSQQTHFKTPTELFAVFLILCMYNFAMTPVICVWSLIFTKPSFGRAFVSIFNLIIVPASYLINFLIGIWAHDSQLYRSLDMRNFVLWPYPLVTMFDAVFRLEIHSDSAGRAIDELFSFDTNGIGLDLLVMLLTGITAYAILIIIELGSVKILTAHILKLIRRGVGNANNDDSEPIDDDVLAEKIRIEQMTDVELRSEAMVLKNVSKYYGQFVAVKDVSFLIKGAECFGLLGKNGAGKTTIFKMLTGETIISSGEIFTHGHNQMYQLPEIYKTTGYCPQFDALLVGLTCRETLEIFAMVRGISVEDVRNYVEDYARNLDFIQHIDKRVKQLSGGNKRKLSTCLAIIGNLKVILLDEPSAGMDPATKRNLWNVIVQSRDSGKSIILTSHSMEECEALCTQLTVLVNGKCKCLGSPQHLKNKFNKGFQLKIKVKQDDEMQSSIQQVKDFVANTFSGASFRNEYQGLLTYSVITETIKWSSVFEIMEEAKKILNIEDYSISQNSLEQVVLKLLNEQIDQIEGNFNEISFNDNYLKM